MGHVSPRTGPLAGFAEADDYVLKSIQAALAGGVENNGKTYDVQIISKDSQSNPNRAAEVAADLILGDEVDIIVAASTPDTTNPVADQAEVNEVPCITTDCPWQPYFFGRNGNPAEGFQYTYHFFWGLEDVIGNFLDLWGSAGVAKTVVETPAVVRSVTFSPDDSQLWAVSYDLTINLGTLSMEAATDILAAIKARAKQRAKAARKVVDEDMPERGGWSLRREELGEASLKVEVDREDALPTLGVDTG